MNKDRPMICKVGARKELYDLFQQLNEVWKSRDLGLLIENKAELELLRQINEHIKQHVTG